MARRASPQGACRDARTEAWPSWQGSALLARRRRAPLAGSSPAASASRCDVVQRAGRPAVTRRMLVRPQPSQSGGGTPGSPTGPLLMLTAWIHRVWPPGRQSRPPAATARASNDRCVSRGSRPGLLADRGCRPLKPATRVRIPLGASRWGNQGFPHPRALGRVWRRGLAVSRVRRVRFPSRALLAVAQWTSTTLLPWPTGVRLLPARLRRKASSEPSGRDPDEQGAIPWRRLSLFASRNPRSGFLPLGSPPATGQIPEGARFAVATAAERKPHACERRLHDDRPTGEGAALIRR